MEQKNSLANSPAAVNDQQLRAAAFRPALQDGQFLLAIDERHDPDFPFTSSNSNLQHVR
jgi:hypothetical protein